MKQDLLHCGCKLFMNFTLLCDFHNPRKQITPRETKDCGCLYTGYHLTIPCLKHKLPERVSCPICMRRKKMYQIRCNDCQEIVLNGIPQ